MPFIELESTISGEFFLGKKCFCLTTIDSNSNIERTYFYSESGNVEKDFKDFSKRILKEIKKQNKKYVAD